MVQDKKYLRETGRAKLFRRELMHLSGDVKRFILTPTNEEVFIELAKRGLHSYKQMPIRLFQIADKFRNILKPKGILRSKQFLMCDMISLDKDKSSLKVSARCFENIAHSVFKRLRLKPFRVEKEKGNSSLWCKTRNT